MDVIVQQLKLKIYPKNDLNGTNLEGIESIKFVTHNGSYNYGVFNNKRIYVVGKGRKLRPGHPSAHHSELNQTMVWASYRSRNGIHVIHEKQNGEINYMGLYYISEVNRKISNEGWVYSELELMRY